MAGGANDEDEITGINVTPLVDVFLVLLIIFMVTASFLSPGAVELELPHVKHAEAAATGPLRIALDAHGALFLDDASVSEAALTDRVKAALASDPQANAVLSADQAVPYGQVMHLMDVVRGAGVSQIALSIEKDPGAAPR